MKNNKQLFSFFFLMIFLLLILLNQNFFTSLVPNTILMFKNFYDTNFIIFFIFLGIITLINFLSPLPTFPILIINGFFLNEIGFYFSYFLIILSSLILFVLAQKFEIYKQYKKNTYFKLLKKINNKKFIKIVFFVIISSRYILPYFLHNIIFGLILKKMNLFFIGIIVAEIPTVYLLNNFGKNMNDLSNVDDFNLNNVINSEYIITIILFLFLILIFYKSKDYLKKLQR